MRPRGRREPDQSPNARKRIPIGLVCGFVRRPLPPMRAKGGRAKAGAGASENGRRGAFMLRQMPAAGVLRAADRVCKASERGRGL